MAHILVVDDEPLILNLMAKSCRIQGHTVSEAGSGQEALKQLDSSKPDLMIVDLNLGDMTGLDVIRHCNEKHAGTRVIMVTGFGTIESAVEAMRLGAFDYVTKPLELADLQKTVHLALNSRKSTSSEASAEMVAPLSLPIPEGMIGSSSKMRAIQATIKRIADKDSPVLLEGEFGAGKQTVARNIHNISHRSPALFKTLQCSALPEDLLEAELFGSPNSRATTLFARAAGGTLLLEEINLLPMRLQSKLDAYLEEISTRRTLGNLPPEMDVRFIASSAVPLQKLVDDGNFREDLFYKISIIPIQVPALRSRPEDILPLIEHFLKRHADRTKSKVLEVDKYALRLLQGYNWPGNIDELENALERACAFAEGGKIRPMDLPPKVAQKVEITDEDEKTVHHMPIGTPLSDYVKKQEKLFIQETIRYNDNSPAKAASMLGVSIATLYRKLNVKVDKKK